MNEVQIVFLAGGLLGAGLALIAVEGATGLAQLRARFVIELEKARTDEAQRRAKQPG